MKETDKYECVFCGTVKPSPNGTGGDVACCGKVGHVEPYIPLDEDNNDALPTVDGYGQ